MRKIKALVLLMTCLLSLKLDAAGPMMHVVLGERWLASYKTNFTQEEKKLFLLGTVFPDIRYLGVIKKEQTHFPHMTLLEVKAAKSPFQQGMFFHSFVDAYRKKLVKETGIDKKLVDVPTRLRDTFLKLIEDQIVNNTYNWSEMRDFLSTIPEDEKKFGIHESALLQWHTGLTLYFTASPTLIVTQIALLEKPIFNIDATTIQAWSVLLPKYVNDPAMRDYVTLLIKSFDKAMAAL